MSIFDSSILDSKRFLGFGFSIEQPDMGLTIWPIWYGSLQGSKWDRWLEIIAKPGLWVAVVLANKALYRAKQKDKLKWNLHFVHLYMKMDCWIYLLDFQLVYFTKESTTKISMTLSQSIKSVNSSFSFHLRAFLFVVLNEGVISFLFWRIFLIFLVLKFWLGLHPNFTPTLVSMLYFLVLVFDFFFAYLWSCWTTVSVIGKSIPLPWMRSVLFKWSKAKQRYRHRSAIKISVFKLCCIDYAA